MTAGAFSQTRVVVAGAGFAGLFAAKDLAAKGFAVTVADKRNYHTFFPLLYQVAAAELEPEQIAYPARGVFRSRPNIAFAMAEVTGLDASRRVLTTDAGEIAYDYLLLALGSETNYFGVPGAREHAFGLKTLNEGVALRNHILTCFERAALTADPAARAALLTFTIIGGGATGIEYAGALRELIKGPLTRDYGCAGSCGAKVMLLEAGSRLLPGFGDKLAAYAGERLRRMGVDIRLGAKVTRIEADCVHLDGGEILKTRTAAWTAGVRGPAAAAGFGLELGAGGRLAVTRYLQTPGHPEIFAAGDMAVAAGQPPIPMTAPAAIQEGRQAARNIELLARGEPPEPFAYRDKGVMAVMGRGSAVAGFGRVSLTGLSAWLAWLFVHVAWLIGFRNRLVALSAWAADFFFFERSVRLILPGPGPGGRTGAPGPSDLSGPDRPV
ncbi:MAG: NAD(P)/FAD-dependent oxidoreductase [Desulfovibrionaceae bacterium]|nr:NAD(P)/FAD-dependent oxidoreductase [Desulfovibrionaceae bacterium]MBF0512984.1 NAD(P)/FAD-dependent oxidoreductase [Desulfovibrionaceae bacterium]